MVSAAQLRQRSRASIIREKKAQARQPKQEQFQNIQNQITNPELQSEFSQLLNKQAEEARANLRNIDPAIVETAKQFLERQASGEGGAGSVSLLPGYGSAQFKTALGVLSNNATIKRALNRGATAAIETKRLGFRNVKEYAEAQGFAEKKGFAVEPNPLYQSKIQKDLFSTRKVTISDDKAKRLGINEVARKNLTKGELTRAEIESGQYQGSPGGTQLIPGVKESFQTSISENILLPVEQKKGIEGVQQRLQSKLDILSTEKSREKSAIKKQIKGAELTALGAGVKPIVDFLTALGRPVKTAKDLYRALADPEIRRQIGPNIGEALSRNPEVELAPLLTLLPEQVVFARVSNKVAAELTKLNPKFVKVTGGVITVPSEAESLGEIVYNIKGFRGELKVAEKIPGTNRIKVVRSLSEISTPLSEQAGFAGKKVLAVSAQRDLFRPLKGEVEIRKPIPNEALLPDSTKALLRKFDEGTIKTNEIAQLNRELAGSKGLLETSFFADPQGRLRPSRLALPDNEVSMIDILTEDFSFRRGKPQALFFEDVQVAKFPPALRNVERKLKSGLALTEREKNQLLRFQLTPTGEFKPIGFLSKEPEIILAKGEVIRRKNVPAVTLINGNRVQIIRTEIVRDAKLSDLFQKVAIGKGTAKDIAELSAGTGVDFSSVLRNKKYINPGALGLPILSRLAPGGKKEISKDSFSRNLEKINYERNRNKFISDFAQKPLSERYAEAQSGRLKKPSRIGVKPFSSPAINSRNQKVNSLKKDISKLRQQYSKPTTPEFSKRLISSTIKRKQTLINYYANLNKKSPPRRNVPSRGAAPKRTAPLSRGNITKVSRPFPGLKRKSGPLSKYGAGSMGSPGLLSPPKKPTKILLPPEIRSGVSKQKKKKKKSKQEFSIFARKGGRDYKIDSASTKKQAFSTLRKRLGRSLRASGFVKDRTGKIVPLGKIPFGFRRSKTRKNVLVELRNKRLNQKPEVQEIKSFRKKIKKKKIKSRKMIKKKK